jgi:hypothetical protein
MRRDQQLVEFFLRGYNKHFGYTYRVLTRPEENAGSKPAVEAIAQDESGHTLAIEHTLVQAFVGQKQGECPFADVLGPLKDDPSLRIPGYIVEIFVPFGQISEIPRRHRGGIHCRLREWFRNARNGLPEGSSSCRIPGVGFDLTIEFEKWEGPYPEGRVFVWYFDAPRSFPTVVSEALRKKLTKLTDTAADKRILLLETADPAVAFTKVTRTIQSLEDQFPLLSRINEAWNPRTPGWETERVIFFRQVWPSGTNTWFKVLDGAATT